MFLKSVEKNLNLERPEFKVTSEDIEQQKALLFYYSDDLNNPKYEEYLLMNLKSEDRYVVYKSMYILTNIYTKKPVTEIYWNKFKSCMDSETYEEVNEMLYLLVKLLLGNMKLENESVRNKLKEDAVLKEQLMIYVKLRETQYHSLLVFWILSFCSDQTLEDLIPILISIIEERFREKNLRVTYAIFRNILSRNFVSHKKAHQIIKATKKHLFRMFRDQEFVNDMEWILQTLKNFLQNTSSIDNYLQEVFEGKLEDSPYHYDEKFWENNIHTLLENKIELLKAMKKYLKGTNKNAICIAANDIHQLLRIAPDLHFIVEKLGLKGDLDELSTNSNENVRFHAIQTLATCIFAEWSC